MGWETGISIEVGKVVTVGSVSVSTFWININWLWLNPMSSVITKVNTGWGNVIDSSSSLRNWVSGIVLSKGVVIVSWVSSIGVVNTSGSFMVPSINLSNTTTVGESILEWLVWSSILLVFPSWVEISLWSISLSTDVNMTVLKLLNLMLSVWDDGIGLPDWVEDL